MSGDYNSGGRSRIEGARREFIATVGAAALAGCLFEDSPGSDAADPSPDRTDTPTERETTTVERVPETPTDPEDLPPVHVLTDFTNDAWEDRWEQLRADFEAETSIDLNIEWVIGGSGTGERLTQLVQAGNPPDVFTDSFEYVDSFYASGHLATTTDLVAAARQAHGDLLASPLHDAGEDWEVPHGYMALTFQYRSDVYEQLGLEPPTSFEAVLANARTIDESDLALSGYGLPAAPTGKAGYELKAYLAQAGVSPIGLRWRDPDRREELTVWWPEQEVTAVLEFLRDLSRYSVDPAEVDWQESLRLHLQGKIAQQIHVNAWPIGLAVQNGLGEIARNTGVTALPYRERAGVSRGDSWLYEPSVDGIYLFEGGSNVPGSRKLLSYLYADELDRTASLYEPEPTRHLPISASVANSARYRNFDVWEEVPQALEQMDYIRQEVVGDHYGQIPEADIDSPVARYVANQDLYARMVARVVTDGESPQTAYEWGRSQLESRLAEAQSLFR